MTEIGMTAETEMARYAEHTAQLYGDATAERWPTVTQEVWLAKRLGDRTVFQGTTTAEERRERIRQRIVADGRQDDVAGRNREGVDETFAQLFERMYGAEP